MLTEADSHLGLTNRALASRARRVCLAFPLEGRDGERYQVTGRPVPPKITDRAHARAQLGIGADETCVLVFGGSLGARSLNLAAPEAFKDAPYRVVHVAGTRDYPDLQAPGPHYVLLDYLTPFGIALAAADAAVARAGGSIFELAQYGLPSVLIPYPHASADHQSTNARWMAERGAAAHPPRRRAHARAPARGDRRGARRTATRCPRPPRRSPAPTRPARSPTRSSPRFTERAQTSPPRARAERSGDWESPVCQNHDSPERKTQSPMIIRFSLVGLLIAGVVTFFVMRQDNGISRSESQQLQQQSTELQEKANQTAEDIRSGKVDAEEATKELQQDAAELTDDALEAAKDSDIPDDVKKQIEEAQKQLEGGGESKQPRR